MNRKIKYFFLFLILQLGIFIHSVVGQDINVTITDIYNQPLSGASIFDAKQTWFRLSGEQGQANIPVSDTIFVQYLGFELYKTSWSKLVNNQGYVQLETTGLNLPEIVVRKDQRRRDLSQQKISLSAIEIQNSQLSTPVDALADVGGAFIQKSQHGGGSPIIRGFEANRVLLVIDGVRLNNAIYRSGHLQNGITIDESALAAVDLTYGPGALAYGSDALGGVVHFKTKEYGPAIDEGMPKGWNGQAFIRLATGRQEASSHLGLSWQGQKWSSYSAITASQFGDAIAGNNRPGDYPDFGKRVEYVDRMDNQDTVIQNTQINHQIGSAYKQVDVLQKVIYQPSLHWKIKLNVQFSTSSDVPRYDALSEYRDGQLRFAEWYYGPQKRLLGALTIETDKKRWYADWLRMIISSQDINEDRYQRRLNDPWREVSLVNVVANNLTIDAQKRWDIKHSLQYGIDARMDEVEAVAFQEMLGTNERLYDINTRYPSEGSELKSLGAYMQYRYASADSSMLAELGVRFSEQSLETIFGKDNPIEWPSVYTQGIGGKSQAFTWAGGLRWKPSKWIYRGHIASGFRAPNVDDFAKFREKNGFIQIPNPSLKPEQSISTDLSIERSIGHNIHVNFTMFHTWLRDIIIRQNFRLPDGNHFFISKSDTLFVQANQNSGSARIFGFSVNGNWSVKHWQLSGQLNYTQGKRLIDISEQRSIFVPLDHIPPLFGSVRIRYQKNKWELGTNVQFQAAKKLFDYAVTNVEIIGDELIYERLGSSDNLENSPIDPTAGVYTGSYAWWTLQFQASYKISQKMRLRLNANNLLDVHYRTFSSGISAQGRMFILGGYVWF